MKKTKVSCITTIISRIRIKGAVSGRKKNYYNIIHQSQTSKKWHCYKRKLWCDLMLEKYVHKNGSKKDL